jgi:hypothetical protein
VGANIRALTKSVHQNAWIAFWDAEGSPKDDCTGCVIANLALNGAPRCDGPECENTGGVFINLAKNHVGLTLHSSAVKVTTSNLFPATNVKKGIGPQGLYLFFRLADGPDAELAQSVHQNAWIAFWDAEGSPQDDCTGCVIANLALNYVGLTLHSSAVKVTTSNLFPGKPRIY